MNTIERIKNDELTQEEQEVNMDFCDAIDAMAEVYGVNAEALRQDITMATEEAILDLLSVEVSNE